MTQDERDARGGNPPPGARKVQQNEGEGRGNPPPGAGDGRPPAPASWLRNVNDYVRTQPREYQVMRFG